MKGPEFRKLLLKQAAARVGVAQKKLRLNHLKSAKADSTEARTILGMSPRKKA